MISPQLGEPLQLIGQISNLGLFDGNLRAERSRLRLQHPNTGSNLALVQLEEWRSLFDRIAYLHEDPRHQRLAGRGDLHVLSRGLDEAGRCHGARIGGSGRFGHRPRIGHLDVLPTEKKNHETHAQERQPE